MKYICNLSGGLCSFWAAFRTVEKYGRENVVLLFADTLSESLGLYRFNAECSVLLNLPITRVSEEIDPWELFRKEGMIANDRFPICSKKLKREPLNNWMQANFNMSKSQDDMFDQKESATVVLGFDWTEAHRVETFQKAHPDWRLEAPMTEEPIWDKCKMQQEATAKGLTLSEAYLQGFPHDNCGGRCVRAGISHWVHTYHMNFNGFMEWENEEYWTMAYLRQMNRSSWNYTILKRTRNKVTSPFSLRQLREEIEAGLIHDKFDWGGCGCGGVS